MHDDISDAIEKLDRSERAGSHQEKAELLGEALDTLKLHLEDHPESPHGGRIENLKRTHARRLLEFLTDAGHLDMEDTFEYIVVLVTRLGREVDELQASNPTYAAAYRRLLDAHREPLRRIIEPL